jgi:hypothetical protein
LHFVIAWKAGTLKVSSGWRRMTEIIVWWSDQILGLQILKGRDVTWIFLPFWVDSFRVLRMGHGHSLKVANGELQWKLQIRCSQPEPFVILRDTAWRTHFPCLGESHNWVLSPGDHPWRVYSLSLSDSQFSIVWQKTLNSFTNQIDLLPITCPASRHHTSCLWRKSVQWVMKSC